MRKALTIHHHINQHTLPKRPWPIQRDGDMWRMYFQHATAKTISAIAITKVKGHATANMVETGQVRATDKLGNDKADEAADEGVLLFGAPMVRLSKCYAKRHIAYSQLVADIQEHMAFVYRVRAALLQHHSASTTTTTTKHTTQTVPTHQVAPPTHRTSTQPTQRLTQLIQVQQCPHLCKRLPATTSIQAFLLDVPLHTLQGDGGDGCGRSDGNQVAGSADAAVIDTTQLDHGTFGITWLELYTLYRMAGYPEPLTYDTTQATARPTLRQQLHNFRHATRQLVTNTMPQQTHGLFRGKCGMHGKRLHTLGINTNLAILPWQPDITPATQQRVAQEILRSQHRLSLTQACAALAEGRAMPLRQMQLKGRVKWSASIKPTKQALYNQPTSNHTTTSSPHTTQPYQPTSTAASTQPHDYHTTVDGDLGAAGVQQSGCRTAGDSLPYHQTTNQPHHPQEQQPAPTQPQAPLPQLVFFMCPRCPHQLPGTRIAFRHNNLDTKLWCNRCQRSLYIKTWRCQCGLPWHHCPQHKHEPDRLRRTQAAKASNPPNQTHQPTTSSVTTTTTSRARTKRYLGTGQDEHISRWLDMPAHKQPRTTPTHIELDDPQADINADDDNPPNNKRALKTTHSGPSFWPSLLASQPMR